MTQQNGLGIATQGVQYFDGTVTYSGVTGTTGQVLQANTGVAPTFVNLSTLGVTSLTGTANQVLVNGTSGSATTGAITLTLPQSIATTSNVQFGSLGLGVAASGTTGRLQTTGDTKFGSSASLSTVASHEFVWVSEVGSFITLYLTGTMTNVSGGGAQAALEIQTTFNASSGAWASADGAFFNPTYSLGANLTAGAVFRSIPTVTQSGGFTLGSLYGFRASAPSTGGFTGTLTNHYGFYAEALNVGTNRYGGYFLNPAAGTIAIACYADNLSLGYNVSPPTNGAIISGSVAIGSSSATASAVLALTSTTKGFLPSVMTTTQRNAISSPATGLTIYNSTTLDLENYNGSTWVGASGSGVTSITGTANQITASASTGAVTLSLPNGISIGSYQATSPPSGGIICPGNVGMGTNAPQNRLDVSGAVAIGTYAGVNTAPSNGLIVSGQTIFKSTSSFISASVEIGSSDRISFGIGGTKTSTDGTAQTSIYLGATYAPTSTTTAVSQLLAFPQFNPPTGVTITTAYNMYLQSGSQGGLGTITNGIGLYVTNPSFGTNKIALYSDNINVNYSTATTTESLSVKGLSGGGIANFYNETANSGIVAFQTSNASGVNPAALVLRHTRGNIASPTATQNTDVLGVIDFGGYTNALYNPGIAIIGTATETWSATAAGSKLDFYVTNNTTVSNSLSLTLSSQGSVVCGGANGAAIATTATDGFLYLPSCNGTPTGTPTTFTGRNAVVYDTSANKIWVYNGSWRGIVVV